MLNKKYKLSLSYLLLIVLFYAIFFPINIKIVSAESGNNYPVVFVHGLYGWGKDDLKDNNYWGGKSDLIKDLNDKGFKVMSATVGAISSNWDRACELYYYIKGGTVDYGAAHSAEYGHERYGKTFEGIYKEWDGTSKLHFIGHSLGGETVRLLIELLKNGSKNEQAYYASHKSEGISPLFLGGKDWVESITAVATPLNGATFANYVDDKAPSVKSLFFTAGTLLGTNFTKIKFDLKLDQWGLKKNSEESLIDYMVDAQNSKVWRSTDNALTDLTTDGAEKLNNMTGTYSDIYYFSYNGNNSVRNPLTGYYLPKQISIGSVSAVITGRYRQNNELPNGDKAWWKNDGTVSVISAQYPIGEAHKDNNGIIEKGIWIVNSTMDNWGHSDFVGLGSKQGYSNVLNFYVKIVTNLQNLPK